MIEALHRTEAKGVAALTLYWLSEQADESDQVRASLSQIVGALGKADRVVRDALQSLIEIGEIEVVERAKGRRPYCYRVANRITVGPEPEPEKKRPTLEEPRQMTEETAVAWRKTTQYAPTSGIRAALRTSISGLDQLLEWCREAENSATAIYHVGQIGYDRTQNADLNSVVETVQLFAETGFVVPNQHMMPLPAGRQIAYTITRAHGGYAPRYVLSGDITARDFGALRIIQHRQADLSATRALRDGLGISEQAAAHILRGLASRKMIQRGHGGGWVLTDQARRLAV